MDFETLVAERRSIRGYKPDPVPKELIDARSSRSPSARRRR